MRISELKDNAWLWKKNNDPNSNNSNTKQTSQHN